MIASVSGTVSQLGVDRVVVEVGGVGLSLLCTPAAMHGLRTGGEASLATALVVREDSLTLYGFASADERDCFELLQTASGVGPKLARAVLAVFEPEALRTVLATSDLTSLTRVPGIGRKGAERLALELRDKFSAPVAADPTAPAGPRAAAGPAATEAAWRVQVRSGLAGLGWTGKEVESSLDSLAAAASPGEPEVAEALRGAIAMLGRR